MRIEKLLVVERDGGLRRQRLDQGLDIGAEGNDLAGIAVYRIQQLKDANDIINGILHGNGEEVFGSVARPFIELPGSGKIEVL